MTDRWSREHAREQWRELRPFVGYPLAVGIAVVGLWPSLALAAAWDDYENPAVALAVYLASVALVGGLWWRGASGLSLPVSLVAGVALLALDVALILQVVPGEPYGPAMWMGSWGAAVPMVLGFGRPVEEPVAILAALAVTNSVFVVRTEQTVEALHAAPLHIAMPLASATSGLALVEALRRSAVNARRSRAGTEALAQHRRVAEAVDHERSTRMADWEGRIAPLLEEIARGSRSVHDPELGARCRRLAVAMRSYLGDGSESILHALLPADTGVELTIHDQDVGRRLVEADRIELVTMIRELCPGGPGGSVQITLLPDGDGSTPTAAAVVILAADGPPPPAGRPSGTLVAETSTRWWFDMTLRCEAAPALAAQRFVGAPPDAGTPDR